MKYLFSLMLSITCLTSGFAQELNCTVTVNTGSLKNGTTADQQVFSDLKTAVSDFMNNKRWTNDNFNQEERIKCNLVINLIRTTDQFSYESSIQFQVFRPVFGTNYETMLLNHVDKGIYFSFRNEDRQMIFNENVFQNVLPSTLGFYALLAVGLDYDSFAKLGGTPHFQRAVNLMNLEINHFNMNGDLCSKSPRSKYCLSANILSAQLMSFREGLYQYHRQGLDLLTTDAITGRKNALSMINGLKQLQGARQNIGILDSFLDAKNEEFINIFSESSPEEKQKIFNTLSSLDPGKTEQYRKLIQADK